MTRTLFPADPSLGRRLVGRSFLTVEPGNGGQGAWLLSPHYGTLSHGSNEFRHLREIGIALEYCHA